MAYNGMFPFGYQSPQMYYQPSMQAGSQYNNSIIWVQGEAGAKSYMMAPNQTAPLWDSEKQVIYLKSTDASGMPSMKVLDYTIRNVGSATPPTQNPAYEDKYVTKEELKAFKEDMERKFRVAHDGGHVNEQPDLRNNES